ncbi:MAG: DUF4102 domain-containing protein [Geminicoccaceae bacterium]|nr:DUF4102 domain-containing protein [Geminicoccaceae bacterium]
MSQERLMDRRVQSSKPSADGGCMESIDLVQRALRLRVTPNGVKSWSVQTTVNGRPRRVGLGEWPAVSLAQARNRAVEVLVALAAGQDPTAEKRVTRQRGGRAPASSGSCRRRSSSAIRRPGRRPRPSGGGSRPPGAFSAPS